MNRRVFPQPQRALVGDVMEAHQAIHQSKSQEWFTPPVYVNAAREVMGGIDLDPASCAAANAIIGAPTFYDRATDGLSRRWYGRIWLNPPYGKTGGYGSNGDWNPRAGESNAKVWTEKLLDEWYSRRVSQAVLLVNAVPGQKWFRPLFDFPICFTDHRIRFIDGRTGAIQEQPTHSNAFVYLGTRPEQFAKLFGVFGTIVVRYSQRNYYPPAKVSETLV